MPIFSKFILIRSKGTRKHGLLKDYSFAFKPNFQFYMQKLLIFKSLLTGISYTK